MKKINLNIFYTLNIILDNESSNSLSYDICNLLDKTLQNELQLEMFTLKLELKRNIWLK